MYTDFAKKCRVFWQGDPLKTPTLHKKPVFLLKVNVTAHITSGSLQNLPFF